MKSTGLFALFLISAFTSYLNLATAQFVNDTDGDMLRNGGVYYILPVIRGRGGGIQQAYTGNETCPLTVAQSRDELSKGLPIEISSPLRIAYVYEGLILQLAFTVVPSCALTPSTWTIVKGLPEGPAVKLTGYENIENGWFHIEKASFDSDYKLVFCSIVGDKCGDIGVNIDDNGIRRLVVTDNDSLVVRFQKVESPTASSIDGEESSTFSH